VITHALYHLCRRMKVLSWLPAALWGVLAVAEEESPPLRLFPFRLEVQQNPQRDRYHTQGPAYDLFKQGRRAVTVMSCTPQSILP
jgi:hypothetical protein